MVFKPSSTVAVCVRSTTGGVELAEVILRGTVHVLILVHVVLTAGKEEKKNHSIAVCTKIIEYQDGSNASL